MLTGNTIVNLVSKNSTDLYGISSKLLKAISYEIEAYIFSLSLLTGIFPEKLKSTRVFPFTKLETLQTVTTTGLSNQ